MYASADLPRRHRLSVADYYRMAEVGILDPEARVELIDGDIIDRAPPGSPHAATVHFLNEMLMELWLADVGSRRLTRYRAPLHGAYTLVGEPPLDTALEVEALAGVAVDLEHLFG